MLTKSDRLSSVGKVDQFDPVLLHELLVRIKFVSQDLHPQADAPRRRAAADPPQDRSSRSFDHGRAATCGGSTGPIAAPGH